MAPPIRLIYVQPDIENTILYYTYQASNPEKFAARDDDKFIIYGGSASYILRIVNSDQETLRCFSSNYVSIFVLSSSFIIWSNTDNLGVEVPYQLIYLHALDNDFSLYLQVENCDILSSSSSVSVEGIVELKLTESVNNGNTNRLFESLSGKASAIYQAMTICSAMHSDSSSENENEDEDENEDNLGLSKNPPAIEIPLNWLNNSGDDSGTVIGNNGDADDLDEDNNDTTTDDNLVATYEDEKFWSKFWKLPSTCQEINEILTLNELRRVQRQNAVNYITLVQVLCHEIIRRSRQEVWTEGDDDKHILNCIRLLIKLLPPLFELENYFSDVEHALFWDENVAPTKWATLITQTGSLCDKSGSSHHLYSKNSLAVFLMMSLVSLLFTKGFTVSYSNMGGTSFSLWEPGIGLNNAKYAAPIPTIDSNRAEVLKLIIVLCSTSLYLSSSEVISKGSRFLTILVSHTPKVTLLTLVSSLTNITCRSSRSAPVENALHFDKANFTEIRHLLVTYSLQLLTLMISYPIPSGSDLFLDSKLKPRNMARHYMGRIQKEDELRLLAFSSMHILRSPLVKSKESENGALSLIKNVNRPSLWALEIVVLMWELIQCNKHFKALISEKFLADLMVILLYYIFAFHEQHAHKSLVQICAYFLLYLSSELDMIKGLFYPMSFSFYDALPSNYKLSITPLTTRDFLVSQISTILLNNTSLQQSSYIYKPLPSSLLNTLVEILYNLIGPVSKEPLQVHNDSKKKLLNPNPNGGLSYHASSLITQLVGCYSNQSFLLEKPLHLHLVALIVRAICAAIIKHPRSSRMLSFCMLKNEKTYNELWNTVFSFENVFVKGDTIAKIEESTEAETTSKAAEVGTQNAISITRPPSSTPMMMIMKRVIPRNVDNSVIPSLSELESIEASLRPQQPPGMTERAREKKKKDIPIGKSWTGKDSLTVILTIILPHLKSVVKEVCPGDSGMSIDSFDLVKRIENSDFSKIIDEHKNQISYDLLPGTPLEQLKFLWSHLSLGWYISLLLGSVYNAETSVKTFLKSNETTTTTNNNNNNNNTDTVATSSSTTTITTATTTSSSSSCSTTTTATTTTATTEEESSQWIDNALSSINIWGGTRIRLFKVESISNDSFFANFGKSNGVATHQAVPSSTPGSLSDITKRLSDLNMSNTSPAGSGLSTPIEEQESYFESRPYRNSVTSLHSLNSLNRTRSYTTPGNSISH
ncbi:hypothetical protein KGF56_002550 [Candida oxycetoniae]|uniref:Protein LOT5 n=1 Tax=Candida oxycetoniae TaxID=497107 RepID=A0AAI9SWZ7_9ASCO|nr:uncharacterized protein KGF56_002550 [Candida oxycetoniae]KAI3404654.2 hypothetical protein KGF56_002550 [Candida oxycetoniae]